MKIKPSAKYYLSRFNENSKYIKQLPDSCEIVQVSNGRKTRQTFSAPYPSGDEDLTEVPAHEYYRHWREAIAISN